MYVWVRVLVLVQEEQEQEEKLELEPTAPQSRTATRLVRKDKERSDESCGAILSKPKIRFAPLN